MDRSANEQQYISESLESTGQRRNAIQVLEDGIPQRLVVFPSACSADLVMDSQTFLWESVIPEALGTDQRRRWDRRQKAGEERAQAQESMNQKKKKNKKGRSYTSDSDQLKLVDSGGTKCGGSPSVSSL